MNDDDDKREDTAEAPKKGDAARSGRLSRLGRRILERGDDVKELAAAALETGDRAKSEMVRMVAREVRNYLEELKLKDDLMELVRSHSLEIHASIHLKPLVAGAEQKPSTVGASLVERAPSSPEPDDREPAPAKADAT